MLANAQQKLGLKDITLEAVEEMSLHLTDIDYNVAREEETKRRHDGLKTNYEFINSHGSCLHVWISRTKGCKDQ